MELKPFVNYITKFSPFENNITKLSPSKTTVNNSKSINDKYINTQKENVLIYFFISFFFFNFLV